VLEGKVSEAAARDDYGVVVGDPEATRRLREAPRGERPFFDRGPGYERLAYAGCVKVRKRRD
jgi:N-methylhydantoinase B